MASRARAIAPVITGAMTRAAPSLSLTALAGVVIAGCATTPPTASETVSAERADDCFFASTLSDWRPLDDQNLILFAMGREPYHVRLIRPAFGLDFNVAIGVYDRDGRICPYGGDSIVIDGGLPDRIAIRSIRELSDAELETLYVAHGIEPPAIIDAEPAAERGAERAGAFP